MSKANRRWKRRMRRGIVQKGSRPPETGAKEPEIRLPFELKKKDAEVFFKKFLRENPGLDNPAHEATERYLRELFWNAKIDYFQRNDPQLARSLNAFFNDLCHKWKVYQTA